MSYLKKYVLQVDINDSKQMVVKLAGKNGLDKPSSVCFNSSNTIVSGHVVATKSENLN